MEDMMMVMKRKEDPCSSALGMHKDSQRISKVKPKIRIIHIFAPEIIKTDVENFRELVQRLTGKPSAADLRLNKKARKQKQQQQQIIADDNKKAEMMQIQVKEEEEEEEMWNSIDPNNNSSGGFLSGFSDLDGFIQELDDFSMMHSIASADHFHAFGETQLA